MLVASGKTDTALTLCREIAARAPQVGLGWALQGPASHLPAAHKDRLCALASALCRLAHSCLWASHQSCPCSPQARWAHRRCGYLLAAVERYEEGVTAFQAALKSDVHDACGCASARAGSRWSWTCGLLTPSSGERSTPTPAASASSL